MTALENALIAERTTDRKVKAASAKLGQARRWSSRYPDRWPPERISELERALAAARKELTDLKKESG